MPSIPYTEGRLSLSLVIRAYQVGDNYVPIKTPKFAANEDKEAGKIVGAATAFIRDETRKVEKRRSLGARGMRPFQVIPQGIEIKLSLKRVALYREEFLKEIGGIDGSLLYQEKPMILQEVQRTPTGSSDIFEFHDCWFVSNPMSYDISGDLLITQDIEVECAYMKSLSRTFFGIPGLEFGSVELLDKVFKF